MPKRFFFTVSLFVLILAVAPALFADTVMLLNGDEVKGLVVDEYIDRIVMSTFEGEKTFLRKDIGSIQYEGEETRLLKLAETATGRGRYKNAIYYYETVLKLNPDSVAARDGEIAAIRKQLGPGAEIAREEIALMLSLDETVPGAAENETASYEKNVRDLLGIKIKKDEKNNTCYVEEVIPGSAAADYKIKKGDIISAVWNDNVKYMSYEGMMGKLAGPEFSMIKLSIEREAVFPEPKKIKLDVGIKEEGYFIKGISAMPAGENGSASPGDWVLEINSASTRYMPMGELNKLLSGGDAPLVLLVKRDLYMTREKER